MVQPFHFRGALWRRWPFVKVSPRHEPLFTFFKKAVQKIFGSSSCQEVIPRSSSAGKITHRSWRCQIEWVLSLEWINRRSCASSGCRRAMALGFNHLSVTRRSFTAAVPCTSRTLAWASSRKNTRGHLSHLTVSVLILSCSSAFVTGARC